MPVRKIAQFRKRRPERGRRPPGKYIGQDNLMTLENVGRHIELAPRNVERKRPHNASHAESNAGGHCGGFAVGATENLRRQRKERRRCLLRIAFELGQPGHRVVVEIETPRFDQIEQRAAAEADGAR